MGYEVKMFIVRRRKDQDDGWCHVLGMVDLSKPGPNSSVVSLVQEYQAVSKSFEQDKRPFIYESLGENENEISEDKYGDPLALIPAREFMDALEEDNKKCQAADGHTYRRFDMAIALLGSVFKCQGWQGALDTIFVLTYGH